MSKGALYKQFKLNLHNTCHPGDLTVSLPFVGLHAYIEGVKAQGGWKISILINSGKDRIQTQVQSLFFLFFPPLLQILCLLSFPGAELLKPFQPGKSYVFYMLRS